jgi:biopolymer transport protein ExbB
MKAFWEFFTHHWFFAIPMMAMSATGVTLVIWRLLLNLNAKTDMNEFLPIFQDKLDKEGIEGALRFCKARQDIIPRRLFVAGLETAKQGASAMRRSMANVIELEIIPDLNFLLPLMLAIAKIATMVGLFGTVCSMIGTFQKMGESKGDPTSSSADIGLALFATALGLITAIPLVFSHVLFKAWIVKFETKMKAGAQRLLLLVQNAKPGDAKPAAAAPGAAAATGKDATATATTAAKPATAPVTSR